MQKSSNTQPLAIVLRNKNYVCKDVPGDGNCLYNSLCESDFFREYSPKDLRKQYITRLKREAKDDENLRQQWKNLQLSADMSEYCDLSEYCDNHSENGTWGGSFEACLMSYLFSVNIRFATCESKSKEFTVDDTTMEWLCIHNMIAREEASDWPTITLLFHSFHKPLRASAPAKRNHFLLLIATGDEEEIAPTLGTIETIEISTDGDSDVGEDNTFVPGVRERLRQRKRRMMLYRRNQKNSNHRIAAGLQDDKMLSANKEANGIACSQTNLDEKHETKRTHKSRTISEKYEWTHLYHHLKETNMIGSQKEFLLSGMSDPLSVKDRTVFSRWYKKYLNGDLYDKRVKARRDTKSELHVIDQKLLMYIRKKSGNDGKGSNVTWTDLQKATQLALQQLPEEHRNKIGSFNGSIGYISNFLKRYVMKLKE